MVKSATKNSKAKVVKSPARKGAGRTTSSKVDELKLGKFDECNPMRLPESQARRSWQIIGGVALLLIAGFCLVSMVMQVPFAYLWQTETDIWQAELTPLTISWIVNNITLVIFTVVCLAASILLFAGKRVARGAWYVMILTLMIGFISQSVGIYQNYTLRDCVEETCPMVVGELSMVLLCDLVIMMVSVILLWLVYCLNKRRR